MTVPAPSPNPFEVAAYAVAFAVLLPFSLVVNALRLLSVPALIAAHMIKWR
jgi:hypothetical protein